MAAVDLSIFELFKVGPGPSSSHTIGPMACGFDFRQRVLELPEDTRNRVTGFQAILFGSLSATGQGHGTDRAIAAGLMGWGPDTVEAETFAGLLRGNDPTEQISIYGRDIPFSPDDIEYGPLIHDHPFANTLILRLVGSGGTLVEKTYYSIGGGFIQWEGYAPPTRGAPLYRYDTWTELSGVLADTGLSLSEIMTANETAITGRTQQEILTGLDRIIEVMEAAVNRGLKTEGLLPGPVGLTRKAPGLRARLDEQTDPADRMLVELNACALAGAEENAAGGIVVHRANAGFGRGHTGNFTLFENRAKREPGRPPPRSPDRGGGWFPDQTQCQYRRGRSGLPGGNRGRLGHGRRPVVHRPGLPGPSRYRR